MRIKLCRATRSRSFKGLTLVEILIASVIFVVVAGMIITAVMSGWRAHVRTDLKRQAQKFARNLFESISDDIRAGSVTIPVGGSSLDEMSSAVLWPDCWNEGGQAPGWSATPYYRGTPAGLPPSWMGGAPSGFDQLPSFNASGLDDVALNKLIVVRGSSENLGEGEIPDLSDFRYVEYDVPAQNQVARYVYRVSGNPDPNLSSATGPLGQQRVTDVVEKDGVRLRNQWMVQPAFFGGLAGSGSGLLLGGGTLADHLVVDLPRAEDRVEFLVSHIHNDDAGYSRAREHHHSDIFQVGVRVFMGNADPPPGSNDYAAVPGWIASEQMLGQVKVMSAKRR